MVKGWNTCLHFLSFAFLGNASIWGPCFGGHEIGCLPLSVTWMGVVGRCGAPVGWPYIPLVKLLIAPPLTLQRVLVWVIN